MARTKLAKDTVRLSVSLDKEAHSEICRLAEELGLSAAWLVRKAVSDFVAGGTAAELTKVAASAEKSLP